MNQKPPADPPFHFFRTMTVCTAAALLALVCVPEARAARSTSRTGSTCFRDTKATNTVLLVGEAGGHGVIRDIRVREERLNAPDDAFRAHFRGSAHP